MLRLNVEFSIKRLFRYATGGLAIMQIDKISFNDISIFHQEEEFSIFHKLNFTRTSVEKNGCANFLLNLIQRSEKDNWHAKNDQDIYGTCKGLAGQILPMAPYW